MSKKRYKHKNKNDDNTALILFRIDKLEEEEVRYHREHMARLDKIQETISKQNETLTSHGNKITMLEEKVRKIEDVNEELENHGIRLRFLETSRTTIIGLLVGIGTVVFANIALEVLKVL